MRDLWTALALVLVIEGALYALFPEGMKRAAVRALSIPPQTLRLAGLSGAGGGGVFVLLGLRCSRPRLPQCSLALVGFSSYLAFPSQGKAQSIGWKKLFVFSPRI